MRKARFGRLAVLAVCLPGVWLLAAPEEEPSPPSILIDAVEAVEGREVVGQPAIHAEHKGFRYLFATRENADRFVEHPDHYEVMWEGACGRMGPLSGKGRPEWYAVHEGRIFIFASSACRETFVEDPTRCIDADDVVPVGSVESARRARELMDLAVTGKGGAERVDALTSWREHRAETAADDPAREDTVTLTLVFPDGAHLRQTWGDYAYERFVRGDRGGFRGGGEEEEMTPLQVASMRRELAHHPLWILRARDRANFVCIMDQPGEVGGVKVERVRVHFDGAATTLSIDPESGRILATEYRDRGKRSLFGDMRCDYSEFREVGGIAAPFASMSTWEGEPLGSGGVMLDRVEADVAISPEMFGVTGG